jgi:hypothetical protein
MRAARTSYRPTCATRPGLRTLCELLQADLQSAVIRRAPWDILSSLSRSYGVVHLMVQLSAGVGALGTVCPPERAEAEILAAEAAREAWLAWNRNRGAAEPTR